MINIIIFSFNRPSQLELLIRSMKYHFKEFSDTPINILYKFNNLNFEKGYQKVKYLHPDNNINWKLEENFKNDLVELYKSDKKYTTFFVDDNVFKEDFSLKDDKFKLFDKKNDIICLSLRLHPRLTYCYPASLSMTPPVFDENNIFHWQNQVGDYGYPMSLDGHIFRTTDLLYYINHLEYKNPNSLESLLSCQPIYRPLMICYDKSIIINNPINKVQNFNNNIHGNITAEYLNDNFLNGKLIDLDIFNNFEIKSSNSFNKL